MDTLDFAGFALLGVTLFIVILLIIVMMRVVKVVSGRSAAQRARAERGESAMLSMALQEALTKLKQQERATAARAEASERLAGQIVEGLTSGLVVVDRDGVVQSVNPAARRILELDKESAGVPLQEFLASAPAMADVINEALQGASPILRRTISLGKGKSQHLGVTVSPITDTDGSLQAAVCLFTDLTAVVQLEEQLRLKEALARLGELTAGLAHEFRNGLATIHGYGRLLDPQSLPEQARTCVEGIRAETIALGEVVTNFLKFARPEQLTLAPVDLRSVIMRAVDDLAGAAASTTVEGNFGIIEGDDVLLRQAFNNLLRNSLEACESARIAPRITILGDTSGNAVSVVLEDNGPGFEPEALHKAFQPFATTKATGTGLGLAIVQKVIVSHNGHITAGNRAEGGARFQIRLPRASRS